MIREQVEQIIAKADEISWQPGSEGGPIEGERYADRELSQLVQGYVDAAVLRCQRVTSPPAAVDGFTRPPVDVEAERAIVGFLLWLQPGEPTRHRRQHGRAYSGDYGCTPAAIWRDVDGLDIFDPFLRWLFFAMQDAARRHNWVSYLLGRRDEVEGNLCATGELGRELLRLGEATRDVAAFWWHLPYWVDRVKQAARRREDFNRGRAIVRASFEGFVYATTGQNDVDNV